MTASHDHPVARAALAERGWRCEPHIDIAVERAAFADDGYQLPDGVARFIATFTGLELVSARGSTLRIDPLSALSHNYPTSIEEYGAVAGIDLYPVGEAYHGHMVVMRATNGASYVAVDWTLARLGHSDLDSFETFLTDGPLHYLRR